MVIVALLEYETVTDGDAVPDLHILAVKLNVKPVKVVPELFCNNHVALAFEALPLPK